MAEFKLGRIRFVWKNDWASTTTYYKDDVVRYGGKVYICVIGHEASADFFSDFTITPPKWNLVSDGQSWKGTWATSTSYIVDDIVSYGARLYICNTNHTSAADSADGLELDLAKWDVFADGLDWKGNWAVDTRYKVNDVVKYGAGSYVCNTAHTSTSVLADGLENDIANWDVFNQGIEYKSEWQSSFRYKVSDVVRYGSGLWICTTAHTSALEFGSTSANWEFFVQGFQYEDEWNAYKTYQQGDIVRYGGNTYVALTPNTEKNPYNDVNDWKLFSEGLKFLGDWGEDSSSYEYRVGEVVRQGGYTYICVADHQDQQPPNSEYWQRLTSGLDWRGEWRDDAEYFLGDVIRYGSNTYICVAGHISEGDDYSSLSSGEENSRPDQDLTGTYWNILAIGREEDVMTTKGDLVYYASNGPSRLPIGENGQVLQVNASGVPEWAYMGAADDVYYVAEHGVNSPAPDYGRTIDRPWANIRYATQQIEHGTKNPNARRLLELNRRFIQREIVEWTDRQIALGTSPFSSGMDYNSAYCERDMGFIIDALIWDITHGGNVRSREAALSYVNDAGKVYTKDQDEETVASINYGLTVIEAVLNQEAPASNYQEINGDNSTAIVEQWFDSNIASENVLSEITGLVGIITDAITAGVATNIPERLIRNTLIKVSTGKYYEVLPIIVPAECCVMGDELRSVQVFARKESNSALTPRKDVPLSFEAFKRLEPVLGDIVRGYDVDKTDGNIQVQSAEFPYGEARQQTAITKLARSLRRTIDSSLGDKLEIEWPGIDSFADDNYGYARNLLDTNRDFVKAELVAFLTNYDADLKYSRTKCKEDVGFIIDGIMYDLTYGGNWQSINTGLAYYSGTNGVLQIADSEKTATLAAYAYLKSILQTISRNITVSPTYQSEVTQVTGTSGSLAAANTIRDLVDDIITVVNSGPGNAPATVYPTVSSVESNLSDASTALSNASNDIQLATIDFISKNFGSFTYNSAACRRDLDYILTDVSYDVALGTNYGAVNSGIAYLRPNNAYNYANERVETIGAINFAKAEVADELTDATAISRSNAAFVEISDIIENGSGNIDTITYPAPSTLPSTNAEDAKDQLQANKTFIQTEITAWIDDQITYYNVTVPTPASVWYGFSYDSTKCSRDVGYIVDALSFDILYGGTLATTRMAQSYVGISGTAYPAGQSAQTALAYDRLATVVDQIVREVAVSKSSGNALTQDTTGTAATSTEGNALIAKMQIIEDVVTAGTLDNLPAITYPDLAALNVSATLQSEQAAISSAEAQIILDTIQYINTTFNDFNYDQAKCMRDVGLIIDACRYDFMLGSTFASTVAALSYLRLPSAEVVGDQKDATIAALEFAKTQALGIVTHPEAVAGIETSWEIVTDVMFSGSSEGGTKQVNDENSYNAIRQLELNKDFIVDEVQNYVDYWFSNSVSSTEQTTNIITVSDTSWMKTNMAIKFTNLDDSTDSVSESGLTADVTYYVKDILSNTTFTVSELPGGTVAVTLNSSATPFNYDRTKCSRDTGFIVDAVGYDTVLGTNYNAVTTGLSYARGNASEVTNNQLTETVSGIRRAKTIATSLLSVKNDTTALTRAGNAFDEIIDILSGSGFDRTICERDLGLIYDGTEYDILFGTNYNAVNIGLSYQRAPSSYTLSSEFQQTIRAIEYLKGLANSDLSGDATAQSRSDAAFDEIIDIISNGIGNADALVFTDPGVDNNKLYARQQLVANRSFIATELTNWISTKQGLWKGFSYDAASCRRDTEYLVDSIRHDAIFNSNYRTVSSALRYLSASNSQNYTNEKSQTLEAFAQAKALTTAELSDSTIISRSEALWDEVIDIITNGAGSADAYSYPTPSGGTNNASDANYLNARNQLVANKAFIQDEIIEWIADQVASSTAPFKPDFTYDSAACSRDVGLIVDALIYDETYGGNLQTYDAAKAYYDNAVAQYGTGEKSEILAALAHLKAVVGHVVTENTSWSKATALTQDTSGTATSTSHRDNVTKALVQQIYDTIDTDGTLPTRTAPDVTWTSATFQSEYAALGTVAQASIATGTTTWINNNVNTWSYTYDSDVCERDTGYIVDALCFDVQYGGNFATRKAAQAYFDNAVQVLPAAQRTATAESFAQLASIVGDIVQNNYAGQTDAGNAASNTETTEVDGLVQIIEDVITANSLSGLPSLTAPSSAWVAAGITSAVSTYSGNETTNINDVLEQIEDDLITNADTLSFPAPSTASTNIQNAVAQLIANRSFLQDEVTAWIATQVAGPIAPFTGAFTYDVEKCSRDVGYLVDALCYDMMYGGNSASIKAAQSYFVGAVSQLGAGEAEETVAAYNYLATIVGYIITENTGWTPESAGSQDTSGTAATATEATLAADLLQIVEDVINAGDLTGLPDVEYPDISFASTGVRNAQIGMLRAKTDIQRKVLRHIDDNYSKAFTVSADYDYNQALCTRDVISCIDAMKWDMTWPKQFARAYTDDVTVVLPALYETKLAARWYVNAVIGSQEEDFYYLRNNTGLRLQTMNGLEGDVGPANAYGTSRVTAGAYASLDPGWGPDDERAWISARSPYVQNCTTFGYAATGQRIDGALHNGGNDSMVSNDFTQLISDGIGAHILNNGRAELVSVFTYYSHIGYLAETGGRIRGTNGNNSYGTFGSVAEGVDPDESPITATTDSRTQYQAIIANVETNLSNILRVEYSHAGNNYTKADIEFFGAGVDEVAIQDEFRDKAIFEARLLDLDDSSGEIGGDGFTVVQNTAQDGSTTSITLSATDGNSSTAYIGMKVIVTGGAGVGQFALVDTYNSGSKIASVVRETDGVAGWNHFVPGTPIVAPNSSSTYQIEPAISIDAPTYSSGAITMSSSNTWIDAKYANTAAQYTAVSGLTSGNGLSGSFDVTRNGSAYYVEVNNGGTAYQRLDTVTLDGSDLGGASSTHDIVITITTVDDTTGEIIDFDFIGQGRAGQFLAIQNSGTAASLSNDGVTWSAETLPTPGAGNWSSIANGLQFDGSTTYMPSATVIVCDGSNNVAYSADNTTWSTASLPVGMNTGSETRIAFGSPVTGVNRFVVVSSADTDVAYSDDGGATWTLTSSALASVGFNCITHGAGLYVAVRAGTTDAAYSADGITWTGVTLPGTATGGTVSWGNGRFVTLGGTNGAMYSLDGITWYDSLALPLTATERKVAYGQGMFVITSDDTNEVQYSEDGVYWQAYTLTTTITGGYNACAFGNPDQDPKFVLLPNAAGTGGAYAKIGATAKARPSIASEKIYEIRLSEPGSGYDELNPPTLTVVDPNNIYDINTTQRIGNGVLAQPSFVNRGTGFQEASAEINDQTSNGYADFIQEGAYIAVKRLTDRPVPGANVVFASLPDKVFKLVNVVSFLGSNPGSYTAFLQISPDVEVSDTLGDETGVESRIRYSQVRLTGHDFLDIGTGGFTTTNYPNTPLVDPDQTKETVDAGGGRVFYTATDQDGNFRVGGLFSVEQATGVATLDAEAFNIAGLQELSLGEVTLGGNSASITEFSTDPFFTANSDTIVPTQRAIKAYIESQIGGGGATLNVNTVTAGDIFIGSNLITTVSGQPINIKAVLNFQGGITGLPIAYNYMLR